MTPALIYFDIGHIWWDYCPDTTYEQTLGEFLAYIREYNPQSKRRAFRLTYRLYRFTNTLRGWWRHTKKLAANKIIYIRRKRNKKEVCG